MTEVEEKLRQVEAVLDEAALHTMLADQGLANHRVQEVRIASSEIDGIVIICRPDPNTGRVVCESA